MKGVVLEVDLRELGRGSCNPTRVGCPSVTGGKCELGQCFEWKVVVCHSTITREECFNTKHTDLGSGGVRSCALGTINVCHN